MKLHLPKKLLAAVMALFAIGVGTTVGADTISINFGNKNVPSDLDSSFAGVQAAYWNNITGGDAAALTKTWDLKSAGDVTYSAALTLTTPASPWGPRTDVSSVEKAIQQSYLDLANYADQQWTIDLKLDDTGYAFVKRVSLYFSADNDTKYCPILVGDTSYIGGATADNEGTGSWGIKDGDHNQTIGDHNTLTVTNIGTSDVIKNVINRNDRATISGMQIEVAEGYKANINGTKKIEEVEWMDVNAAAKSYADLAVADRYMTADVSGGNATLVIAADDALSALRSMGAATLTLQSTGSITLPVLYVDGGSGVVLDASLKNKDLLVIGDGNLTINKNQTMETLNSKGSGTLYIADGVVVNVTGFAFDSVVGGVDSELNIALAEGSDSTVNGITVTNNKGTVSMNGLVASGAEITAENGSNISVSSAGGTILVKGAGGTVVEIDSVELTANAETILSTQDGVTLVGDDMGQFFMDYSGRALTVGKGVELTYHGELQLNNGGSAHIAESYAIRIGNGMLNIAGGVVSANSLIMLDNGSNKTGSINITEDGLLEITGTVDATYKMGSVRLGHWGGDQAALNVTDGEFRVLNAVISMGDDGSGNLIVGDKGIANLKGIIRLNNDTQLQVNGGILNIGEGGVSGNGTINVNAATLGALDAAGWSTSAKVNLGSGSTVQLATWDVENKQYTDTSADITLGGEVLGGGSLTLAGSGRLTVSSALAHDVSSTGGQLALTGLSNCEFVGTGDTFTGYGDSTTDGYASTMYRIAGAGSTITEAILIKGEGNELTCAVDAGVMTVEEGTMFVVNTEVDRAKIDEWKEGTTLVLGANSVYRTSEISDLGVIDNVVDDTAAVYVQNTEGKDLLKITNVPTAALNITIGGEGNNEITCDDASYTGNFTVLSGTTLKQTGNDKAGEGYDSAPDRTITIQKDATFDISGAEAYYHIVLEEGATLANTGSAVTYGGRNLALIELDGDATVNAASTFGVVFGGYGAAELHLNGNTLTKIGANTFHLNNCTLDAGTIRIEEGFLELMEHGGPVKTDVSAATFEVCSKTVTNENGEESTVSGCLYYGTQGTNALSIGHLVASGGNVQVTTGKQLIIEAISGTAFNKLGSGTLTLADGIKVDSDIAINVDGGGLVLSSVEVATGKTLSITGAATASTLSKKGEGSLTIAALTADTVNMSSGISIASLTGASQITYTDVASIGSITALGGDTIIDILGVADSVADGINLGIAYTDDNLAKIQLIALDDMVDADGNATWELVDEDGFIKLQGKDGAKITLHTDWDINWGGAGLSGAPAGDLPVAVFDANQSLVDTTYNTDGLVAVSLGANGIAKDTLSAGNPDDPAVMICGGKYIGSKGDGLDVAADVWIHADGGAYGAIVGGNMSGNWGGSTKASSFTGDTHILIDDSVEDADAGKVVGDFYTHTVIGGNYADAGSGQTSTFTGNTFVSIFTDSVGCGVVGASTLFHGGNGTFTGNSNVFVYAPLTDSGWVAQPANTSISGYRNEGDKVIGGALVASGNMTFSGSTKVLVDLTDYTGTATSFDKKVIGGMAGISFYGNNVTVTQTGGDVSLTIKGTAGSGDDARDITFADAVVGGILTGAGQDGQENGNGNITVGNVNMSIAGGNFTSNVVGGMIRVNSKMTATMTTGDISLDITAGTFSGKVVGSAWHNDQNVTSRAGDVSIKISGDDTELSNGVVGGAYIATGSATMSTGNIDLSLQGGSVAGDIVGAHVVNGTASAALTASAGDISIAIDGATTTGDIYGGSVIHRNNANATAQQGDITVSLTSGTVEGNVYAAGYQNGSSKMQTASTTVEVGSGVTLTAGKVVSAGYRYGNSNSGSTITGDRTIMFTGDADQDRTGILFSDFNKIGVETAGKTATIGGADITITDALTVIGNGTIKLATNTGLIATKGITIEKEATVAVNGNAVTGDVVANGGVNVVGGGSLNGMLTLAAGSTLTLWDGTENGTNSVLDMSVPTVDGASLLAEGNVLTIGGLFGLDVKVNPDGEVELVTGLGGIEGITFDEENKALAGTYLSDINGEDVDGKLYLVYEEGTLKLSAIAGMTDFYWEDTDATGETWTEKLWSVKDNNSDNLVFIKDAATRTDEVNAFFNNGKAENVLVDTTATVDDLTVSGAGSDYTFSQATGTNGTLTIEGKLTVTDSATATFDGALADVGAAEMEVSKGATLVAGAVTITDGVTVDAGTLNVTSLGAASLETSNGASIDADNVVITGKVGVDSAGLDISDSLSAAEITITGDTASVEAGTITVGEGGLNMAGGTLAVDTLTGEGTAEITGGTLTIGSTDLSSVDVSGAEFVGTSTLAGSDAVDVTVGGVSVADGAELNLSDATLTDKMTAGTDATLTIDGAMHLDVTNSDFDLENKSTYAETTATDDLGKEIADGGNGFVSRNEVYTVVTGDLTNVDATGADWTVGADARVGEYDGGKVTISESKDTTAYWVNTGAVEVSKAADNFADDTATIKLNGGILKIDEDTDKAIVTNNENAHKTDSQIALLNGSTLEMEKLTITDGTTVTLSGSADSALELGDGYKVDSSKLKGLDSTDAWLGTVKTGAINGGLTPVDISGLGNANSSVEADSISGQSMTAGTVGTVDVLGDVSLTNGDSTVNDMTVEGNLSLGATADSSLTAGALTVNGETGVDLQNGSTVDADTLTVTNGGIDLSEGSAVTADEALTVGAGITLGKDAQVKAGELKVGSLSLEEGSSVGADTLTVEGSIEYKSLAADAPIVVNDLINDSLNLTVDTELLKNAVDAGQDVTFITVNNGSEDAEISLNGGSNILKNHGEKYSYTVDWDDAGQNVTLDAIANENYMKEKFEGAEPNAIAGATLMDEAFASDGIGAGGDLEKLLAAVDNGSMTEEGMAAVAGASTASLGMAFAGDVERQLRAIRNRTTTMGVNQCVVNEGMPYFNAWVNAEGNFGELDQDGLASGYQLDSWGGTVGFDVDVNPNLTLGLAVTAMYGDLTVDGPDMLEGDMDTYYVTAFARYSKRAWTHTFIGTIGMMDGSYERTVNYAGGSYKTEGDTDGMAFGLMYEVGRVYALTEDGDACLQPVFNIAYRHTTVGGYTEDGGDAALDVDDQTLDTITLGAGARFQAVVGENLYNRTSVLELRALAKLDVGDRASEADVAFIGGGSRATVESAELGAFGVELGAGLSIPVGDENDGTIFFDVSAELRSGYSNVNGTVGYRINF
ncbi:MAG: hypothetical protein IJB64_05880 [Akkermansia sp.]|nr:hypothetical protein [Akkermansia sp.]